MTDIDCENGVALLMDYLEDTLPVPVRAAIDAHVNGCPRCKAFIASYLETPRIVREATEMQMPEALQKSLLEAVRKGREG